ncbi:limonene-1,2-epoxide hydrolase family protein [Mycobacterium avium]|uniref:limonene-1,2-epoxide hydrolase family protein n=1 Tax=Mycobacterium avium TaxID=1764 RepID=UPI001CC6337C|nr:limonene-1,2-epoxide hydrolase family protein [Mycobacterium avium]
MVDSMQVVLDFCQAMVKRDAEALRPFLAEGAVYQNVGKPAFAGVEAIVENLASQFTAFPDSYEYRVVNIAVYLDVVLTERLDMIRTPSGELQGVPVMGAFEVRDGKIHRWTDYWDSALVAKMLSGEDVSGLVPR